jgi:photosystem II stability/assembly factor-like uncharacterized protein
MSGVRVLVGTKKGAFVLSADDARSSWDVSGPHFPGREVYHVKGSPADPDRIYAAPGGWSGPSMQRSDDGGSTWHEINSEFAYDGPTGTHQWYDGSPHPWEFARVWHLEPSPSDPEIVWAGVEDAALFRTTDGGDSWHEIAAFRNQRSADRWSPGAGGMCLHTILIDPGNEERIYTAVSAAGVFLTEDAGKSWRPINNGLESPWDLPETEDNIGHCVHNLAMHPDRPDVLFMQKHWDVNRSDNAGDSWYEVSGNLPSDFGFVVDVHPHEPETVYVIPIKSDSEHYPPEGKLRVYRSRTGGNEWEALTNGLPQENCYVDVLRDAMAVDRLDPGGIYFGTTGGQVYCSPDGGDNWNAIVHHLPAVRSIEVQTLG